ncbi:uncharacterized protein PG986_011284 [Apiospora aurea]|uniref:Uncharacterized protein n=1 Tax=Apiospora aurea TaxID=335848 RepID=A0ABR1Q4L8_9PEZI
MAEAILDPKVTTLVRQFSLGLDCSDEASPVSRALNHVASEAISNEARNRSEARNFEEWLNFKYPSSDGDTRILHVQCMKVAQLWADFGHRFPSISKDKALPSIETLFEAVDTAAADFSQKRLGARGKFLDGFQNIVGTLNDHSY